VKSKGERFAAESLFMALILRLNIQKAFEYEANLEDGTAKWEGLGMEIEIFIVLLLTG
jgi:hypothetical protein